MVAIEKSLLKQFQPKACNTSLSINKLAPIIKSQQQQKPEQITVRSFTTGLFNPPEKKETRSNLSDEDFHVASQEVSSLPVCEGVVPLTTRNQLPSNETIVNGIGYDRGREGMNYLLVVTHIVPLQWYYEPLSRL
eukprot:sb/3474697/